jgi:hypothetical protein
MLEDCAGGSLGDRKLSPEQTRRLRLTLRGLVTPGQSPRPLNDVRRRVVLRRFGDLPRRDPGNTLWVCRLLPGSG